MTLDELKKRFPNASVSFLEANSALVGIQNSQPEHAPGKTLVEIQKGTSSRRPRLAKRRGPVLRIAIVAVFNRIHDSDNIQTKALRDSISRWFGLDDADDQIQWSYGQIHRPGEAGTIVIVEKL